MSPIRLRHFSTLVFDCYGTLIDWERGIVDELRPWADEHGLEVTDEELLEAFADAEAASERENPETPYPEILEDVFRRLTDRWSVPFRREAARNFGRSVGRWPAFPDSPEALQYLQRHYHLVILSNVDHASFARSEEKLGISFDRVITAEDIGSYKPDPANFRYALDDLKRTLGVAPSRILHTAQSLFHDIVPAKRAGLRTMWVNRRKGREGWGATPPPQGEAEPDVEVSSLAEFVELHQSERGT